MLEPNTCKETVKETVKCCVTGDPYIVTLSNELYKMENFNGYCRLFQGNLHGKELMINAFLKIVSEQEAQEAYESTLKLLNNSNINMDGNKLDLGQFKGEAFFRKLYISYGNENMFIDMETLEILENNSTLSVTFNENISNEFVTNTSLEHYNKLNDCSMIINLTNNVSIIVSTFSNLQVRTGVFIHGSNEIYNIYGPLVKPMNKENYLLPSIKNIKKLTEKQDYLENKGTKHENYVNTDGNSVTKKLNIY